MPYPTRRLIPLLLLWLMACAQPTAAPSPTPLPMVLATPSAAAYAALAALHTADPPARDLVSLTERFKAQGAAVPRTATHPADAPGQTADFWVKDRATNTNRRVTARLLYQSELINLWVETAGGDDFDTAVWQQTAATLEQTIIPTTRRVFGTEWQPGVDGDLRLNLLHVETLGAGTIGYFSAADSFSTAVNPYSNERELFYIALDYAPPHTADYYEVVAHEFQHMIHWAHDSNEATWVNEGLAELSTHLNGYVPDNHTAAFAAQPDTPLTHFQYNSADYGAAYLFLRYLYERLGESFIRALVAEPRNGAEGIEAVLQAQNLPLTFEELVGDWVLANGLPTSPYAPGEFTAVATAAMEANQQGTAAVYPFAADYWRITSDAPLTAIFTGTSQTPLLPTTPASGQTFWTTIPADSSDMTLTRAVDLTAVAAPTATLTFRTWYDIELGWDYAYVAASADGGASWDTLPTLATSAANPQGNNLGQGYTGTSGSVVPPRWVEQTADLTPYLGQTILVRFEYVTDDAQFGPGWALDDIRIPVLGWADDAETADAGWTAVGFVRHSNNLPQQFLVQVLYLHADGTTTAEKLPLNDWQRGRWVLALGRQTPEALLIVTATTPFTALPATYEWRIQN